MVAHDHVQVLGVGVLGYPEIEPAGAFGHVPGAQTVQQRVEIGAVGVALGRGYPPLRGHPCAHQTSVHGRYYGVHDGVPGLLRQRERLIDGDLVHLLAMAGYLGHGHGAYRAAVREAHAHAAVGEPELTDLLHQARALHQFGVLLEMVLGVLAGLRCVGNAPAAAKGCVERVRRVHQRRLAALARRADHDGVVMEGAGVFVYLAGHVRHVALPRDQRRAHHRRDALQSRPQRPARLVAPGAAPNQHRRHLPTTRPPRRRPRRPRRDTCRESSTGRRCTAPCCG